MTQPDENAPANEGGGEDPRTFPGLPTSPLPEGVNLPTGGIGGAPTTEVTKWDVDVLESFAAELDRLSGVFTTLVSAAPEVVTKITGGVPAEQIPPVHLTTVEGVGKALSAVCDKAVTLASSLTRDAAALRAFAKDAAETDEVNEATFNNVDGQV